MSGMVRALITLVTLILMSQWSIQKNPLSPIGESQARLIAALLPEDASKIIVSPLERAKATAKFYCERIRKKI
ncbi:hypothetical protein E4P82_08120 [Candidatus Competibacter phosphatis]|uniref:Uncharacterized protein n=2 Tax=Candidatus Competibacter phosphatis TaxID=221280 RepID=A0ABX1TIG2_9GAMM|nr:hypothetical protein [Candidatus Competibacter phosphatis]